MLLNLLLAVAVHQPKWTLTFSQEFDGPKGSAPDPKVWSRDLGGGGFGNNEMQSYTDGASNAFLDGKGHLIIEARKETTTGSDKKTKDYSSARLKTSESFSQAYGKIEARIKMPKGKGIWPAFWMLGGNIGKLGWPGSGEIDIVEYLGHETSMAHGTIHGPGYSGAGGVSGSTDTKVNLSDDFHTYGIQWEPERIQFTVDGVVYQTTTPNDIGVNNWVYDHPFFIILNLAVGGNWPGYPDATTTFPQQLVVDYVRAYKDENLVVDTEGIRKRAEERKANGLKYIWPGPFKVPGSVPFADFNLGGPEVGYHDSDPENQGGQYRLKDGVDIGASGSSPKFSVGWTKAGEWLAYDLDVLESGTFDTEIRIASDGEGGDFHFELDGKSIGNKVSVPSTGGWTNWKSVSAGTMLLTKGKHRLKLKMDLNGKTGSIGNLLSLKFTKV